MASITQLLARIAPYLKNGRRALALSALALAVGTTLPLQAATPKDTLVVALAFDDIISLDPAEAFEISAGELMGNGYERLLRYDVNDPSRLLPDLAAQWSVSADGNSRRRSRSVAEKIV